MIALNLLLTRKGLDNKRREHEKKTGLKYFYELHVIENEIMSKEFAGKTFIVINISKLKSKVKKDGNNITYTNRKELVNEISKHLDAGKYKWTYYRGNFIISIQDKLLSDNGIKSSLKKCMKDNLLLLLGCVIPLYIMFTCKSITHNNGFLMYIYLLCLALSVMEIPVDLFKFVWYSKLYRIHLKQSYYTTKDARVYNYD